MSVWGTGKRGTIHKLKSFRMGWGMVESVTKTKWSVEIKMAEFGELGFDEEECEWFAGKFFGDRLAGKHQKLMGLCFLATRTD